MTRFVIDPAERTVTVVGEDFDASPFHTVSIDPNIDCDPVGDHWTLLEGLYHQPIRGRVLIDVELTQDELIEVIDFGMVKQLGPIRMFMGERNRREII